MKKNYYLTNALALILIIITIGCSSDKSKKEAQKLLNKQTEVLEKEQKSVEKVFDKLKKVRDSLEGEQTKLMSRKENIENEVEDLEGRQVKFAKSLKEEKKTELEKKKTELKTTLTNVNDSLENINNRLSSLEKKQDTINVQEKQLTKQKKEAKRKLITGIDEIDTKLDEIEDQRLVKLKEIEINAQKKKLAEKKIEILKDEKNVYLREKNSVLKGSGDDTELEKYNLKISEIEGEIKEEKNKIRSAESAISTLKSWLNDVNQLHNKLSRMMEEEYGKNDIIIEFTDKETQRLRNEKKNIESEASKLKKIQEQLSKKKADIDSILSNVDEGIELVKSKELSEILSEKSALEEQEAELSGKETGLHEESKTTGISKSKIDTTVKGAGLLKEIENEIKSKRENIETLKKQIATEQQALSKKQAMLEAKRSKKVSAATKTIVTLIILSVLVLGGLYLLGRRSAKKKKANQ